MHPLREGNGRMQKIFMGQLALQAGYGLDLSKPSQTQWVYASMKSHNTKDHEALANLIRENMKPLHSENDFIK